MSSPVTDQKLGQAKKTRDYLEVQVEAAELKKDLHRLLKGVGEESGSEGSSRPIDRVREAYTSGLEIRAFQQALGNGGESDGPVKREEPSAKAVQEVNDARARIIESLVKAGKTPEEIEKYVSRLGPMLDMASVAKDPVAQLLLYSRFGQNPSEMQFKDVVETIKMVNDMKGNNNNSSDVKELAGALVEAFKAGKEQAQVANPGVSSFEAYQEGMKAMQSLLAQQNETTKQLFQERIKSLEDKISGSDPITYVKSMKEAADALGWGGVDKDIQLAKIDHDEKRATREFEREKTIWEMEREEKKEVRRDKRQSQMIDKIIGGVETALESPVIREAGKMVGSKLEGKVPDVRGQAARAQLTEPLQEIREFTCPKCSKRSEFTNADLVTIASKGGRWVCPTQGCGAAYLLPAEGGQKK